jgi:hypothetical protein
MDYRQLGASGLRVSADVDGARRQIDLCLDRGVSRMPIADGPNDSRP